MNKLINEQHKNMLFVNKKTWKRVKYSNKIESKWFKKYMQIWRYYKINFDIWIPKNCIIEFDSNGAMLINWIKEK